MNNINKKSVILVLTVITSLLFFLQCLNLQTYAKENEEWNVKVTTDTKDLASKETKEISFKVQENSNVAKGKLAPGCFAKATLYLDLTGTKYDVDFILDTEKKLQNNFNLSATIDGKEYKLGDKISFMLNGRKEFDKENGKKEIIILLEWKTGELTDNLDTLIGSTEESLEIPISWEIKQHI